MSLFHKSRRCSKPAFPYPITRSGTQLFRNGKRWKFSGLNADTWFGCWSGEKDACTDANLDRYFSQLNPHSVTRIWPMPGYYDSVLMDRIVAKAEKYGQYLAPCLFNGINLQCSSLPAPSYTAGTNAEELAHINTVVTRYKDTPAIAFWEIINEPDGAHVGLKGFYNEMANAIKAIDPATLVGTGAHAAHSGGEVKYTDDHNVANVDLISMHEYDAATGLSPWADESERAATSLNKPWYAGEDGFTAGGGDTGTQQGNADKLDLEWKAYLDSDTCAGMMYWDFKWAHPETTTVNFDTVFWTKASTFRHAFHAV